MFSRLSFILPLAACLWTAAGASFAPAQQTQTVDLSVATTDYVAFWYATDELDETKILREQITSAEYEQRRNTELNTKWAPLYTQLLQGNYAAGAEYGYDDEKSQLMVQMDAVTAQRLRESPTYLNEIARQMAEWAFFYEQLDRWSLYIEQSVLREPLADDEKTEYNPATIDTELPTIYDNLQRHARQVSEALYKLYRNPTAVRDTDKGLVDRIEHERNLRKAYEEWLEEREKAMLAFADLWGRQYDGSEIWIEGTQYLVRNLNEAPAEPEDDMMKINLPDDAVLLEVPKQKIVTPFDLIHESGELKTPDNTPRSEW